ncbi:acyl-CoA thioesterase [Rufibacter latericius]|uniref:Acyl-CoA thioesterase n=1 Tax=Rufibacter latericius TaxID=2487040 RepID=A0A3M9MQS4_9BACT|nr:acyl-CoA thioesterase [Rufibacter latericius]RNI27058.1 acyl-CoA thioesterase [Rufibacter latericius]
MQLPRLEPDLFRPVSYSRTTLTELMIPSYANFGGKIHGGILLSLMDKVAYACAAKHAGNYCVTVTVDGVNFLQPVEVGELVSLLASVNYVGKTSLLVGIKVIAENVKSGIVKHTNTSYLTMVAKGEDDKPAKVPGLLLETPDDARRFIEAIQRKQIKTRSEQEFKEITTNLELRENISALMGQRCQLGFDL